MFYYSNPLITLGGVLEQHKTNLQKQHSLVQVTAPVCEPITLEQAQRWCYVLDDRQNDELEMLIAAMRAYAENYTRRAYVAQQWELAIPHFPYPFGIIYVPKPPLISVDSISYIDFASGATMVVSPSVYQVDARSSPGRIKPAWLQVWPSTRFDWNAVIVKFTCGYASPTYSGPTPALDAVRARVPDNLKLWMKARISTLFENREHLMDKGNVIIPFDMADGVLDDLIVDLF